MDDQALGHLAYQKLTIIAPRAWDVEALKSYLEDARKTEAKETTIELGWKNGLSMIKATLPKQWEEYQRSKGEMQVSDAVPWEKVVFRGGTTDGDFYSMLFDVDGVRCELECSDVQLEDPEYVLRKLRFRSVQYIDCPYLSSRMKKNWVPGAVFPWLKSMKMIRTGRESITELVKNAIIDFAIRPLDALTVSLPWDQIREPIREHDRVYLPFAGLSAHVQKMTGKDVSRHFITTGLSQLGAERKKKGSNRRQFYSILYETIAADSQTRIGKNDSTDRGSETGSFTGWDGSLIDFRTKERGTDEATDGLAFGGPTRSVEDTDNSFSGLAPSKAEKGSKFDETPF